MVHRNGSTVPGDLVLAGRHRSREKETSVTQLLQLLVIAATLGGLVIFGFIRDRREHPPKPESEEQQQSIYFPEHQPDDADREHRGAAMSRL